MNTNDSNVGAQPLAEALAAAVREQVPEFWVPALGNGQLGQFLAKAMELGLVMVPRWYFDHATKEVRQVPEGLAWHEGVGEGLDPIHACPLCGGAMTTGIRDPEGDYDDWVVRPRCSGCRWQSASKKAPYAGCRPVTE